MNWKFDFSPETSDIFAVFACDVTAMEVCRVVAGAVAFAVANSLDGLAPCEHVMYA